MNSKTLQSVLRAGGLCLILALTLFGTGCSTQLAYTDPNIPAGQRYFNNAGTQPARPTAAQPGNTIAVQPVNSTGLQPNPGNVVTPAPLMPGGVQGSSKLGVGDLLTVNFSDIPRGSLPDEQQHRIGEDGLLTLPFNVQVVAVGKTPTQLQKEIRSAYVDKYFVNLTVTVKAQERFVYVDGEVRVPNRQLHFDSLTVLRAIATAGGFTDFANKKKIEVRRATGGKIETVDWNKARKNSKLDLPLFVNDQVYVHRGIW